MVGAATAKLQEPKHMQTQGTDNKLRVGQTQATTCNKG